ncbi:phosphoenolpyruvate--protein phosphotransferase [Candidatus Palauibacter sp.]|uniref:phosphoenolpyruvate--protein phosphotransferase n=1 Tax=Candidatus Palauibacter sp. TaxID=3101350 RepID=UPI003B5CD227
MSEIIHGIGASPGRALGSIRRLDRRVWRPEHRTIAADAVEPEVARFEEARRWAADRIRETREDAARSLGDVEAHIFDPQILILSDPDLVAGTIRYIRENFLSAERAFDWRLTELRTAIMDAGHVMVVDRLADLRDIRSRVLTRLAGLETDPLALPTEEALIATDDLTPSLAVRLDPDLVLGVASGTGSRTSHSTLLARSLGIPAVVGLGNSLAKIADGVTALLDGGNGRVVLHPGEAETAAHVRMARRLSECREEGLTRDPAPLFTADGVRVHLRANIDQPHDVPAARRVGAEGVGLFRSEFVVIGRRVIPSEEEQYEAYREVVEGFPDQPVTLRTFDIGGDKFPLFLDIPPEDNPYLGWRAIRVCLDLPELFRNQLRAAIRAGGAEGRMRILVPFIISEDEILRTKEIVDGVAEEIGLAATIPLGVMVETPALADTLDLVGRHLDFISLGTNDLTQYSLAVDRGNARLQHLSDPLHPAMVRAYRRVFESASDLELDIGVCGDLAADPVGLALLLALGYRDFSLAPASVPEIREFVSLLSAAELERALATADFGDGVSGLRRRLRACLEDAVPGAATPLSIA